MSTLTMPGTPQRLVEDTEALLRMFAGGGSLAGLAGLSPPEVEALYAFGLGYYRQARYAAAQKVFARLVTLRHGEPRYLNALAASHQMLGQHAQAVHFYGVSQLIDKSDPAPTFHTAHSLLALGLVQEAQEALELVVRECAAQAAHEATHEALGARARVQLELVRARLAAAR
jgi:type III secretion system low calcium response chaperone LcrH/SycD